MQREYTKEGRALARLSKWVLREEVRIIAGTCGGVTISNSRGSREIVFPVRVVRWIELLLLAAEQAPESARLTDESAVTTISVRTKDGVLLTGLFWAADLWRLHRAMCHRLRAERRYCERKIARNERWMAEYRAAHPNDGEGAAQ